MAIHSSHLCWNTNNDYILVICLYILVICAVVMLIMDIDSSHLELGK